MNQDHDSRIWYGSTRSVMPSHGGIDARLDCHLLCLSLPLPVLHSWLMFVADMIHEKEPITNTFVSVPVDMGQLNCSAYIAGLIAGILDGASFVSPITP